MQPPLFVPDATPALRVLDTFRREGGRMALIVDEYGAFQGVLTPTDLLESLVGDLPEPGEADEPPIVRRPDGSWLVDGMLAVDALKDAIGLHRLPDDNAGSYRTVAGLVMAQLRRIPKPGDRFDLDRFRFEVVDMDRRRIDKVLVSERPVETREP
jgi:putative hemolysin